jgi:single-strand DNA-binding protein
MASLNRVFLIGNLTRDPEVRFLSSGTAVADLRMAVSRKFKTQAGEDKEETCFVDVVVWGRQAETCGEYLKKGSQAFIEGRLKLDEWEKNGQKQSRIRVVAERVQFLGAPRRAEFKDAAGGEGRGARAPEAPAAAEEAEAPPAGDAGSEDLPF